MTFRTLLGTAGLLVLACRATAPVQPTSPPKSQLEIDARVQSAMELEKQGVAFLSKGEYASAAPLLERSLTIFQVELAKNDARLADNYNDLGVAYRKLDRVEEAEKLLRLALGIRENQKPVEAHELAIVHGNLASILWQKRDFAAAEASHRKALRILTETLPPDHMHVATAKNNLAFFLQARGKLLEAQQLFEQALQIRRKTSTTKGNLGLAATLNNLARLYLETGNHARAGQLFKESAEISGETLGSRDPRFGAAIFGQGLAMAGTGRYRDAYPFLFRGLGIAEGAYGQEHPEVAFHLFHLAKVYRLLGQYQRAESAGLRALRIQKGRLPSGDIRIAETEAGLGALYLDLGDYGRAETFLTEARTIRENSLGPDHPGMAEVLELLASLRLHQGDAKNAESLYAESRRLREKSLGSHHPKLAESLNNLASFHLSRGGYREAESLLAQALEIAQGTCGPEHPTTAIIIGNLAEAYLGLGAYDKAEELLRRSLDLGKERLGTQHGFVAIIYDKQSSLYTALHDYDRAVTARALGAEIEEASLSSALEMGSEQRKHAYLATLAASTNRSISLHLQSMPSNRVAARLALTTILRRKGRVLDTLRDISQVLRQRGQREDLVQLERLARIRQNRSDATLRGPEKGEGWAAHLQSLSDFDERLRQLESTLGERYAERASKLQVSLESVQTALPRDAALIEFFVYRPLTTGANGGSRFARPHYAAYVLHAQGDPVGVDLGDAACIDDLAAAARSQLASGDPDGVRTARSLAVRIMDPVRELLGKAKDVFISPDSQLNLVPFAALPDAEGRFLVKRYRFTYVTSGRELSRFRSHQEARSAPVIIAAPEFGQPLESGARESRHAESRPAVSDMSSLVFGPLNGTRDEAALVSERLRNARPPLLGAQATEDALKSVQGPRILHIATHGFFLDGPSAQAADDDRGIAGLIPRDTLPPASQPRPPADPLAVSPVRGPADPLLRSGLALAGANRHPQVGNDGILTAMEAMSLDLAGTELVVLSACETGMGNVRTGDGVYGLRRALVQAGAESHLTTLWRVRDQFTARLLADFYDRLAKGAGRSEALRQVMLKALADPSTASPRLWAPFIMSGNPSPIPEANTPQRATP